MLQSKAGSFSMLKKLLELPVRLFLFLTSDNGYCDYYLQIEVC